MAACLSRARNISEILLHLVQPPSSPSRIRDEQHHGILTAHSAPSYWA